MTQEEKLLLQAIEDTDDDTKKRIIHAIDFANTHHEGQIRKSGEPYVIHVLAVGRILWEKFHDVDLAIGGVLHDTVEDCEDVDIALIYKEFGDTVGFIVDAATKDEYSFHKYPKMEFEDKIERQLWAGMKDVRALLVKVADREHNISTLEHLQSHKQIRMAFETQAIYEPLKKLLSFESPLSLGQTEEVLSNALEEKKLSSAKEFKEFLFQSTFTQFGQDLYSLVYENSDKVIWEIEDLDLYLELQTNEQLKDGVETISIWTNGKENKAQFYFKKGMLVSNPNFKLNLSTLKK